MSTNSSQESFAEAGQYQHPNYEDKTSGQTSFYSNDSETDKYMPLVPTTVQDTGDTMQHSISASGNPQNLPILGGASMGLGKLRQTNHKSNESVSICPISGCKHPRLRDHHGLARHMREVHPTEDAMMYYCPIASCKRHTKGFGRKYNLKEHQKRCHPNGSSPPALARSRRESFQRSDFDGELVDEDSVGLSRAAMFRRGVAQGRLQGMYLEREELNRRIREEELAALAERTAQS